MAQIPDSVFVTGVIAPSDSADTYPVIDPKYGIDGLRNVGSKTERNNIPEGRRKVGMVVGVSGITSTQYWSLKPAPWSYDDSDWILFNTESISGFTFNPANYDLKIGVYNDIGYTQNLSILATDMTVTGGTYDPNTGVATFTNNSGGTFPVTGFIVGYTDIYVTGGTFNNNVLTLNRTDNNPVSVTGFTDLISVTKSQLDTLISLSSLTPGKYYKISGVDPNLYNNDSTSGTTIFLQATDNTKLNPSGVGMFYNPKYNQSLTDYGIWNNINTWTTSSVVGNFNGNEAVTANNGATGNLFTTIQSNRFTSSSSTWVTATSITGNTSLATASVTGISLKTYSIGNTAIWGGRLWINITGNIGAPINVLNLNSDWSAVTYNPTDYNLVYDYIEYDYGNNIITKRIDNSGNIVVSSKDDIDYFASKGYVGRPINVFQWGNPYVTSTNKGVGGNQIINSFAECINFIGNFAFNILYSRAVIQGNTSYISSVSYNKLYDESQIRLNTLSSSILSNNIISQGNTITTVVFSTINSNILNASDIKENTLNIRCTINSNLLNSSFLFANYLNYDSNINSNRLTAGTLLSRNKLFDTCTINSNTTTRGWIRMNDLQNGCNINSNTLSHVGTAYAFIFNNHLDLGQINSNVVSGSTAGGTTNYGIANNILIGGFYGNNVSVPQNIRSLIGSNTCNNSSIINNNLHASEILSSFLSGTSTSNTRAIYKNTLRDVSLSFSSIGFDKNLSYQELSYNKIEYKTTFTLNGTDGNGAVGSLILPPMIVPTNYFISEMLVDVGAGLTAGAGAIINLGISTDNLKSGLNDITGLVSTLNSGGLTRILPTTFTKATAARTLVASVNVANITSGTLDLQIILSKLK